MWVGAECGVASLHGAAELTSSCKGGDPLSVAGICAPTWRGDRASHVAPTPSYGHAGIENPMPVASSLSIMLRAHKSLSDLLS